MYANNVRVCHRLNLVNPLAFSPFACCFSFTSFYFILVGVVVVAAAALCSIFFEHLPHQKIYSSTLSKVTITHQLQIKEVRNVKKTRQSHTNTQTHTAILL